MKISALAAAAVFVTFSLPAASQQTFFYPSKGQTPQQQQADQGQCHVWATQQTGFDPSRAQMAPQYSERREGGVLRGAGRGAALGAIGGAIGGNAGKGAAIGAGVGALFGGMRRRQQEERRRAQQQQQQAAISQQHANYTHALGACMSGRGYSVR